VLSIYFKLVIGEKSRGDKSLLSLRGALGDEAILWHEHEKLAWLAMTGDD
jgi:hypothetical protein